MKFNCLIQSAIKKAGSQDNLSLSLDLAPSALSKRINGEVGWHESEINKILEYTNCEIADCAEAAKTIQMLKDALKIFIKD